MNSSASAAVVEESQGRRLLQAVFNYGVGGYLPQLINFVLVPVYSHYIDPTQMGTLEVCLATQLLVALVSRLGMAGAVTRYYVDLGEGDGLRDLVTTVAAVITAVAGALVAIGLWAGPRIFERFLPNVPFHPMMDIALVGAFFQAAPDLQRRLLQAREQSGFSARLSVFMGFLGTLTSALAVIGFGLGATGVLWSGLLVSVAMAAVAVVRQRDDLRGRFKLDALKRALLYGLPLVPHHGAAWLQQFVGRWTLGAFCSPAAVGYLGLATRVASPLTVATSAFGTAYAPIYFSWRAKLAADDARAHSMRVGLIIFWVAGVSVLGAGTFGSLVVRRWMAESYYPAAPVVPVVAAALALHLIYTMLTNEIFYTGNTKWISIIFVFSALTNIVGIWLFAARGEALAAAGAQVAGGVVSCLLAGLMAKQTAPLPLETRALTVSVLSMVVGCVIPRWMPRLSGPADVLFTTMVFVVSLAVMVMATGRARTMVSTLRELKSARQAA
ncbi:MAG: lipopolysaccharide biosynthesis protein [Myxococcaceae bacterium]|nr:lipopolysaccharide biosynthesis protein [Myxococcaceae bacterium]